MTIRTEVFHYVLVILSCKVNILAPILDTTLNVIQSPAVTAILNPVSELLVAPASDGSVHTKASATVG